MSDTFFTRYPCDAADALKGVAGVLSDAISDPLQRRIAALETDNQRLRDKLAYGTFPSECATCKRLRALCGEAGAALGGAAFWMDLPDRLSAAAKGE